MPVTRFHVFDIAFADATATRVSTAGHVHASCDVIQNAAGRWDVREDGHAVAMTDEQHENLARLLESLRPFPDANVEPRPPGCDGTWSTVRVRAGGESQGYRWWGSPPPGWEPLAEAARLVRHLAEAPRLARDQANRGVAAKYFSCLAARDMAGAMACCAEDIEYLSPFCEARGAAEVERMWRAWLGEAPEMRVSCGDVRIGFANWQADYIFLPTKRRVRHQLTAELKFANGKIVRHRDSFNVHEWAAAAFGLAGSALGGSAAFQKRALGQARKYFGAA